MLVQHTLAQFQQFQLHDRGVVNRDAWKLVKRRKSLCVFVERRRRDADKRASRRRQCQRARQDRSVSAYLHHHRHSLLDMASRHSQYVETATAAGSSQYPETESTTTGSWSPGSDSTRARTASQLLQRMHIGALKAHAQTNGADLPVVLAVGTLEGTLQDALLGAVNASTDAMRVMTAYVQDRCVGAAVLATLLAPTPSEPFASLSVKWFETAAPRHLGRFVAPRDAVVLEATGLTQLPNGESVGYVLLHTVHFPQTQPLAGVTRSNVSVCCLVRQCSATAVDVYLRGYVDPTGGPLARALVVRAAVRSTLVLRQYVECGRMKKLAFALEQQNRCTLEQIHDDDSGDWDNSGGNGDGRGRPGPAACCVHCKKRPRRRDRLFRRHAARSTCKLCFQFVCASCAVHKTLHFVASDGALQQRSFALCALCVHTAMIQTDACAVASELAASALVQPLQPLPVPTKMLFSVSSMAISDTSLFDHSTPW